MRPWGREPAICGLIDDHANHYATELLQIDKTIRKLIKRYRLLPSFQYYSVLIYTCE